MLTSSLLKASNCGVNIAVVEGCFEPTFKTLISILKSALSSC